MGETCKILCERMKGRQLNTAFGSFQFDSQGITEVPAEYANALLALNGYTLVDGSPAEQGEGEPDGEGVPAEQNGAENDLSGETSGSEENTQDGDEGEPERESEEDTEDEEDDDAEDNKNGSNGLTVEYLNTKNVAQLKKIAKTHNVDLAGAVKKDEIIPIILGAVQ